jgi:hypothetical protein
MIVRKFTDHLCKSHKVFGRKKHNFCAVYSNNWQITHYFILKNCLPITYFHKTVQIAGL